MSMKPSYFYFLATSALHLWGAGTALAAPVQGTEPAIHVGAPPPAVNSPITLDVPKWRVFTSAEGDFSLMVPTKPISRMRVLHTDGAALHQFFCRKDGEIYIFQYLDKPAATVQRLGAEKMLTINDAALLKISKGILISERQISLGGYSGHEVVISQSHGWKQTQRAYLVGNRAYVLGVAQPQINAVKEAADANKFFNSFTLLSAKMPDRK